MEERISKEFLPVLDKLYNAEPAGGPFRKPVDPELYECYDYYLKIKHPIDLTTIREKLINRKYDDAWGFIADINLMFQNAWHFNKRQTPVYEYTTKLNKLWQQELSPVMQRLGYCCSTLHRFGPQLLFCHGTTTDRYCQIAVSARYKCYNDLYSYCLPCFSKIESNSIRIQDFSSETPRGELPSQPIDKDKFVDCTNDQWQYESFVKCVNCSRRVHQVCSLYPGSDEEIENCIQHADLEQQQKDQCQVPEQFKYLLDPDIVNEKLINLKNRRQSSCNGTVSSKKANNFNKNQQNHEQRLFAEKNPSRKSITQYKKEQESPEKESHQLTSFINSLVNPNSNEAQVTSSSLDDELLAFARDAADKHLTISAPTSPAAPHSSGDSSIGFSSSDIISTTSCDFLKGITEKAGPSLTNTCRDRFLCNICCNQQNYGRENRHRKWSARRIQQTRMSRYIEVKVNEFIKSSAPSAGPITIRVLAAYKDKVEVKPHMRDYVQHCAETGKHPYSKDYPQEFKYTNRAIFAWQEIDGVDVCVFGMHVQEYGVDCPEPNRQVIYLSYLDSVHFFRPKEYRTAVYHQILLSYFRYVKKLGFLRAFIWVCPSRKGDDYIFYRHPTEQKMPTLKRLSDWYVDLLDKGIIAGVIEHHQNIYQYANSQNWKSILSMPYLSGDYWPGEFERLLKIKVESQREYDEMKSAQDRTTSELDFDSELPLDLSINASHTSPEYYESDDSSSKNSFSQGFKNNRRKRRKSNTLSGYLNKKRYRTSSVYQETSSQKDHSASEASDKSRVLVDPEVEFSRSLERSLKRQKEGFIVAHLNECDCSSYFEQKRRDAEPMIKCDLMKGREPFLQTARLKNYEFSTLRRAKFSSLAMVKHLSVTSKLTPLCSVCYSSDCHSSIHYACSTCEDFYLCSSCHLNTHHDHKLELISHVLLPDIDDDHLQCSTTSYKSYTSSSSSSSSSTAISTSVTSKSSSLLTSTLKNNATIENLHHSTRRATSSLSHQALLPIPSHQNQEKHRAEDEENNKRVLSDRHTISRALTSSPPPSTMSNPSYESLNLEIIEGLIHRAHIFHDVDFEKMKNESKALITHYWYCKAKDNCQMCRFVILSCSFMSLTLTGHKPPSNNHNNNNNSGSGGNSNKSSGIMN